MSGQRPNNHQLLEYCDRVGMDQTSLRYATPAYYLDNVRINHQSSERIRDLLKKVDKEYLTQLELDEQPASDDSGRQLPEDRSEV